MKAERLMGIQIPVDCGGEGRSTSEIAELCTIMAQGCAASAMIFAMHQIKVSSLVSHGTDAAWHRDFMQRICDEQLLLGSATTEGGIGGNLRNSMYRRLARFMLPGAVFAKVEERGLRSGMSESGGGKLLVLRLLVHVRWDDSSVGGS